MAYSGYHIKMGSNIFPERYIAVETYIITPNQRMDLDSYRDANGALHRTVLSHTASKIEWNTPYLYRADKVSMMSFLRANMSDVQSRTFSVTYYDDETDAYKTGTFYMPDIAFQEYAMGIYLPTRLALIEY